MSLAMTVVCFANVFLQAADIFDEAKPTMVLERGAGEGPAWDPQLGLLFSGDGDITLLSSGGTTRTFLRGAGSNGLLFDHQGRLLICQPVARRVSRMDIRTGKLEVLTDHFEGRRYNQPNDVAVDAQGRVYFSDPRYGSREGMELLDGEGRPVEGVYRIDVDGRVTRILSHEVDRPNGLVVSADNRFLFVADNNNNSQAGARKLYRFELRGDGDAKRSSRKLLFDWKTGRGPDGMVLDEHGRLYVAGGLNRANPPYETADEFKGGVYVLSADGTLLDFMPIPRDEVTNCTFGGADLKTLYTTAGGTLWSIRTKARGQFAWPTK